MLNIPDLRLRNFVIDQIKRHLVLHNFSEIDHTVFEQAFGNTQEICAIAKIFAHDICQNSNRINIQILSNHTIDSSETIIVQTAYLIKILDTLFLEIFKIENYALKINFEATQESVQELGRILQVLSVSYVVDPDLTLKFDTQSKIVFEFVSRSLASAGTLVSNAFAQGYNFSQAKNIGIYAAIDILQLTTLVEKHQNKLLVPEKAALHVIISINKEQVALALLLADYLRTNLLSTDVIFENASIYDATQKANKLGAKYVLIVGEEEQMNGTVTVKNMQKGESVSVKQTEIISHLK